MCITVEQAHITALSTEFRSTINRLKADVPNRAKDFILELDPAIAPSAIIFRDFPKHHGNLIQRAVGIALGSHIGGYSATEKRFTFLSGFKIIIDNFFVHSSGHSKRNAISPQYVRTKRIRAQPSFI
jgi:hypothetical protein